MKAIIIILASVIALIYYFKLQKTDAAGSSSKTAVKGQAPAVTSKSTASANTRKARRAYKVQPDKTLNPSKAHSAPPVSFDRDKSHIHRFGREDSVCSLMEDRKNDWLARQLKEEHNTFRNISDMFDLKIEHVSHCDADYIKTHYNTAMYK